MKRFFYILLQTTWGAPQTLLGLLLFCLCRNASRFCFHGAVVTEWDRRGGLSLGLFVFIPRRRPPQSKILSHEYGHTLQSLILGPLYLPAVGLPSVLWAGLPFFNRHWKSGQRPYDSVYPENWATWLGEAFLPKNPL